MTGKSKKHKQVQACNQNGDSLKKRADALRTLAEGGSGQA
jgi:hypothetical protein